MYTVDTAGPPRVSSAVRTRSKTNDRRRRRSLPCVSVDPFDPWRVTLWSTAAALGGDRWATLRYHRWLVNKDYHLEMLKIHLHSKDTIGRLIGSKLITA